MTLETERLWLRPWEEADAENLYRYAKDPTVGTIAGWPVHTSVEHSREVIRTVLAVRMTYALVPKEVGCAVGSAGFMIGAAGNLDLPSSCSSDAS